jgi:hypothetical protein
VTKKRESKEPPDVTTLLKDIVRDTEKLIGQQFDLLRTELKQELDQAKSAAVSLGAGAGLTAAGGVLATLMLVHGLHRATGLPLWGCYGLVGGVLGAAGAGLLARGWKGVAGLEFPPPQTTQTLRENFTWPEGQKAPAAT